MKRYDTLGTTKPHYWHIDAHRDFAYGKRSTSPGEFARVVANHYGRTAECKQERKYDRMLEREAHRPRKLHSPSTKASRGHDTRRRPSPSNSPTSGTPMDDGYWKLARFTQDAAPRIDSAVDGWCPNRTANSTTTHLI
eukprot:Platyproteum_vivax@DN2777_c0_g1_i1.p1